MNKYSMSGKLMHKASDHNTKRCEVEKWVFLPHSDFERLKANPYQEHEAITAAKDLMFEDEKAYHCIMLLDEHGNDGLLIEAEGFDYPRLSMFVPDAALIYERYKTSEAELKLHDIIRDTVEKIAELAHTDKTDFTSADDEVKKERFNGVFDGISSINWTDKPYKTYYGLHYKHDHSILINSILNSKDVPREAVKFVIYHEMLHRDNPKHNADFRRLEHEYPNYEECEYFLDGKMLEFDINEM